MAVSLAQIRSELLPGVFDVYGAYGGLRQWDHVFGDVIMPKPHIWVPRDISLPAAVAMGAAAAIIENPVVSRRFWSGWVK